MFKMPTKEGLKKDHVKMFKSLLIMRKDKLLPVYEVNIKRTREFDPKYFKFREFDVRKSCDAGREAIIFFKEAALTYAVYNQVKHIKTFNGLVRKLKALIYSDIKPHLIEMCVGKKRLFNFEANYEQYYPLYFKLYVIAKWLGLKPNKEFKPVFEMVAKDLKDKAWW